MFLSVDLAFHCKTLIAFLKIQTFITGAAKFFTERFGHNLCVINFKSMNQTP